MIASLHVINWGGEIHLAQGVESTRKPAEAGQPLQRNCEASEIWRTGQCDRHHTIS